MDITRFEDQVITLEKENKYTGGIMLYGNSYFAFWDKTHLENTFSNMDGKKTVVVNHGFGGATGAELWHYYLRLVKPYSPSVLVWTEGANDFEQGFSVEDAFGNAKKVFDTAKQDFPKIKIVLLASIETPKTFKSGFIVMTLKYNALLREYADKSSDVTYIDMMPFYYKNGIQGENNLRDIYRDDNIHLDDKGYDEFALFLKEKITDFIKER